MKNEIAFQWVCEWVDEYDDIQDHDWGEAKKDVWPADTEGRDGLTPRLACVRMVGNEPNGEQERGYAYHGDEYFCSGHTLPQHIKRQLDLA